MRPGSPDLKQCRTSHSDALHSECAASPCQIKEEEEGEFWIQCDVCELWYHGRCVGTEEYESILIEKYHCPTCEIRHGKSLAKRKLTRRRYRFDDPEGDSKKVQIGTEEFTEDLRKNILPNIQLADAGFLSQLEDGLTLPEHIKKTNWNLPILVKNTRGLNMRLPEPSITIKDISQMIGESTKVEVIDVYKQRSFKMSIGRLESFWSNRQLTDRLYNVLSLEFSKTKLIEVVEAPELVRELSWVRRFWGESMLGDTAIEHHQDHQKLKPEVLYFCLFGMAGSYTDFHIDFGGSEVWYSVIWGMKIFLLIEPTDRNLALFREYSAEPNRSETFFPDILGMENVRKVVLEPGNTLLIPAGWIHAVYTPVDTLVFGGNILTSLHIPLQLQVYEMEVALNTDDRFVFPSFELCNWYAAQEIIEHLRDAAEAGHSAEFHLLKGARALSSALKHWVKMDKTNYTKNGGLSYGRILKELEKELQTQEKLLQSQRKRGRSSANKTSDEPEAKLRIVLGGKRGGRGGGRGRGRAKTAVPKDMEAKPTKRGRGRGRGRSLISSNRDEELKLKILIPKEEEKPLPIRLRLTLGESGSSELSPRVLDISPVPATKPTSSETVSTASEDVAPVEVHNCATTESHEESRPVIGFSLLDLQRRMSVDSACSEPIAPIKIGRVLAANKVRPVTKREPRIEISNIFGTSSHGRVQKPSRWITDTDNADFMYPSLNDFEEREEIIRSAASPKKKKPESPPPPIPNAQFLLVAKSEDDNDDDLKAEDKKLYAEMQKEEIKALLVKDPKPKKPKSSTVKQRLANKLKLGRMRQF